MDNTIIYLHGFGSSGQSQTVSYLRKLMPDCVVIAPDIPVDPKTALPFLRSLCEAEKPDLVIGTSMGAMYAMQMLDYRRICVNPALNMSQLTDILKVGTFDYFQPTASGKTSFTITEEIIQHFREMECHLYDGLTDESRSLCWGFFGDEDDTVNCRNEFQRQYYPNVIGFHGGHRMNNAILREVIVPFAKMLINEERTDEWGVTYINYGKLPTDAAILDAIATKYAVWHPADVAILLPNKDEASKRLAEKVSSLCEDTALVEGVVCGMTTEEVDDIVLDRKSRYRACFKEDFNARYRQLGNYLEVMDLYEKGRYTRSLVYDKTIMEAVDATLKGSDSRYAETANKISGRHLLIIDNPLEKDQSIDQACSIIRRSYAPESITIIFTS